MAWNRLLCGMKLKSFLHYDIVMEKYDKLVKNRKLAKCGNIGPSSLKRMPATNGLLKKMLAPHGDIVGFCFFYSTMVLVFPKRPLSSSGASFSLLDEHFSGAVKIWLRGTFGRLISSY